MTEDTRTRRIRQELNALLERHGIKQAVTIFEDEEGDIALALHASPDWAQMVMRIHADAIYGRMVREVARNLRFPDGPAGDKEF